MSGKIQFTGKRAFSTIILAAGESKRMHSKTSKVLHTILGKPIILFVLDLARNSGSSEIVIVVGKNKTKVKQAIGEAKIIYAEQKIPRGTGDATTKGLAHVHRDDVLILCGDVPLLTKNTVTKLIETYYSTKADLVLLTCHVNNPHGYGRILRNKNMDITGIVEQKDATKQQQQIKEINVGVYIGKIQHIRAALKKVTVDNVQQELYLTDIVKYFLGTRKKVIGLNTTDEVEIMGINTKLQLARAREVIKQRWFEELMKQGVHIEDPANTSIDLSVTIGKDAVIRSFTIIEGNTHIKGGTSVGPFTWIKNGRSVSKKKVTKATPLEHAK